ncbi:unnamed protein product [Tenebrio molitor]|jgi:hypothetical protein|nr:unnamed protein product [Tenebrio molitor]
MDEPLPSRLPGPDLLMESSQVNSASKGDKVNNEFEGVNRGTYGEMSNFDDIDMVQKWSAQLFLASEKLHVWELGVAIHNLRILSPTTRVI